MDWLQDLADEAEQKENSISTDAKEFLTNAKQFIESLGINEAVKVPRIGVERWLEEGAREKFLAILVLLRERCSPWEIRIAMEAFLISKSGSYASSDSPAIVSVFYEIDRVNRRIVVLAFPDLPGL